MRGFEKARFSMSRFLCVFVLMSVLMPGLDTPASACSCGRSTVAEGLENADAVFIGTVVKMEVVEVDVEDAVSIIEATVQRGRVFKGDVPEKVVFTTSNGCCYCALMYTIAEPYLFFADEDDDGSLSTNACSRTKLVFEAKEELAFLEEQSASRQP
jgi:hypothetical protein